ncbi:neurexin-1a-like isoform X3 [Mizuhopecten yessoensis]|uniref:neurexin-1a-like isoform X3 n=1 Tax=Mizuhopecten yessoensis TaxID=6573 RepID=UPI000B4592D2|nr:neurexin-1a-like isoform X3 [Mizuhopecten yessoensis]
MKMHKFAADINLFGVFYLFYLSLVSSFDLNSPTDSFAKYQKWNPCQNGSIHLEFKTKDMSVLILYMDDGGHSDYFELKLLTGSLHLRFTLGSAPMRINVGQRLNDNRWHKISIKRNRKNITLVVDSQSYTRTYHSTDQDFGYYATNSPVFVGGISNEYEDKTSSLTLPAIYLEPRFTGSIRNILYSNCGGPPMRPELLDYRGIVSENDQCVVSDPCQHGGICVTHDEGVACNCSYTDFEGEFCSQRSALRNPRGNLKKRAPSEVTFFGSQYFMYEWPAKGAPTSNTDEVSLYFRTRQPSGLLFYTGQGSDFLIVSLKNGGVSVTVNLGSGTYDSEIRPHAYRFDDNHWHHVHVKRKTREIDIMVDGGFKKSGTTAGDFTMLSSRLLYVGGSPNPSTLYGARVQTNFKGCMKKVIYKSDSVTLDLTTLAIEQSDILKVVGDVVFNKCHDIVESQPVTFTTPESYIILPSWEVGSAGGSLSFAFMTNEPNGVVMYNSGTQNSDFFAFEIQDRFMYLIIDLGSGAMRIQVSMQPVSDAKLHEVSLEHIGRRGWILFDGQRVNYTVRGENSNLDMVGVLYVGGVNDYKEKYQLPKEMWAGMLGYGFVGCMQDVVINGNKMDLLNAARKQSKTDIVNFCRPSEPQCMTRPCINNGQCSEGWNRYVCDCKATRYVGDFCQTEAATLAFDSAQFMKITLDKESHTEAEDISLRFRTQHPNGLLFMTSSYRSFDSMALYLENGLVKLEIRVGSGSKILTIGRRRLDDDQWHTVIIKRRGSQVELSLDNDNPIGDYIPVSYTMVLYVKNLVLGYADSLPRNARELNLRRMEVGRMVQDDNRLRQYSGFVGSMQQFIFNGHHFFEMAKSQDIQNIETTARFLTDEPMLMNPVTFKSKEAYAQLEKLSAYLEFSVYFKFKTTEPDGLIMYNGGRGQDFLAFELQGGYLHYVYNTGAGAKRVVVNTINRLSDNEWHDVRLLRPVMDKQTIRVDDQHPTVENMHGSDTLHFNLEGMLYVGGVSKTMYNSLPKLISSRHGFQGCLASLDLNGPRPDILNDSIKVFSSIARGCQGLKALIDRPSNNCHQYACLNEGRCVQQWNSYTCDCDMTSYTGPMCTDASVSYTFGLGTPGILIYNYPESKRTNTKYDQMALGFRTMQRNALLVRVESITNEDYIEVQLVDGNVFVVYNMGTDNHPLGQLLRKHNNGNYHVIRFTRSGANATLQINEGPIVHKNPTGEQLSVFNEQARIYIGGYKNSTGIHRQFVGTLQGLVFNGISVLEMASRNDSRITVEGKVKLTIPDRNANIQSTMGIRHQLSERSLKAEEEPCTDCNRLLRKQATPEIPLPSRSNVTHNHAHKASGVDTLWRILHKSQDQGLRILTEAQPPASKNGSEGLDKTLQDSLDRNKDSAPQHVLGGDIMLTKMLPHDKEQMIGKQRQLHHRDEEGQQSSPNNFTDEVRPSSGDSNVPDYDTEQNSVAYYDTESSNIISDLQTRSEDEESERTLQFGSGDDNQPDGAENMLSGIPSESIHSQGSGWSKSLTDSDRQPQSKRPYETSVDHQLKGNFVFENGSTSNLIKPGGSSFPKDRGKVDVSGETQYIPLNSTTTHTTPRQGITDEIIHEVPFSGDGTGCPTDDEDDCTSVSSGSDDDIITPVVKITTTPKPPTTPSSGDTMCDNGKDISCQSIYLINESTTTEKKDKGIIDLGSGDQNNPTGGQVESELTPHNIGLIIGIIAVVIIALIILIIALYKFHRRDEGTYKVDETQNFAYLESKKQNGNGALLGPVPGNGKMAKKKDVKEWYV